MKSITYRIFLYCMFTCATLVLCLVWLGPGSDEFAHVQRLVPTTFVIGLSSFLLWSTRVLWDIRERILK